MGVKRELGEGCRGHRTCREFAQVRPREVLGFSVREAVGVRDEGYVHPLGMRDVGVGDEVYTL